MDARVQLPIEKAPPDWTGLNPRQGAFVMADRTDKSLQDHIPVSRMYLMVQKKSRGTALVTVKD
jgi:hypothetical protein